MNKLVNQYVGLVDFLGDFLGEDAEIVLHDVTDLENSVVAIRNNHISGREIGAPATDLVLKILKDKKYRDIKYLSNYKGISKCGRVLKAATFFIKDEAETIVGLFCININMDRISKIKSYVDEMMVFEGVKEDVGEISETFSQTAKELTFESIHGVVDNFEVPAERMSQEEKIEIIDELSDKGIFLIKGAVSETAIALKVSEATVYRYLGKIKKSSK